MTPDDARPSDLEIKGEMLETLMKEWRSPKGARKKKRRKRKSGFKPDFVKLPMAWVKRLRAANVGAATYQLAIQILIENFKLDQMAVKEIVLSAGVTGLSPWARQRAINNLVKLKLIKVKRRRGAAARVTDLFALGAAR
jgi:hypothetical protein